MTPILSSTILRTQSDARLLALAARGHERAFEAIVERYRRPLHRWCRTVLPEARAEDAVQTAFLNAWSALRGGTEVAELRPWLYRIARNAAVDAARKAGYDYAELSESLRLAPAPEADLERRSVMRETLKSVAGLPENQRQALLRTAAGERRADIARDMHVSEGAVRQLVHRARTTLRAAATAVTPAPLVSWAAAMGSGEGALGAQRIAELAAAGGSAGIAATAVKAGTVVVAAGVLAAGPGTELRDEMAPRESRAASAPAGGAEGAVSADSSGSRGSGRGEDEDRSGPNRGRDGDDDRSGRGSGGSDDDSDSDNSGPGSDSSGSGSSGDDSDDDSSGSGSSGSGSSGSGSPDDDSLDSSGSGSGTSGSGSGTSGSGTSGSGTSGSGTSGSGTSGSGTSGSGTSESGSSGSGSGDSSGSGSSGSGSGSGDSSGSGSGSSDDD